MARNEYKRSSERIDGAGKGHCGNLGGNRKERCKMILKEDYIAHNFYEIFVKGKSVKWNEFPTESRCGYGYYEYYYAEDELYLVRDRIIGEIYFIKAKSPKEAVEKRDEFLVADIMEDIDEQPTADVVEVVYCRDCIHRADIEEVNCGVCEIVHRYRKYNDYCSYGERREK